MYLGAERSGGHHAENSHCASTVALRALLTTELLTYLSRMPPELGLSIKTMQPNDCMVFIEAVWVPNHGRTVLSTGETCPAASSLRGVLTAFEHLFKVYGRSGEWSLTTPYNNPCLSALVADYGRGLGKHIRLKGPRPLAAHPLSYEKLTILIDALGVAQASLKGVDPGQPGPATYQRMRYLISARDALLFVYLLTSLQRGGEGACIGMQDLSIPGGPFPSVAVGDIRLLTTDCVRIHPPTLKSFGGPPPPSTYMDVYRNPDDRYCFLRLLYRYMGLCSTLGAPLTPTSPLFRPMGTQDCSTVREESITTSACYSRLQSALAAAGVDEGESTHSFRRGGSQAAKHQGKSKEETMGLMHITTDAVYERYTDEGCATRYTPLAVGGNLVCSPEPVGEEEEDLAAAAAAATAEEDRFAAAFAKETAAGSRLAVSGVPAGGAV